jgi:hypothetical protein
MKPNWPVRIITVLGAVAILAATAARIGQGTGPVATSLLYIVVAGAYLAVGPVIIERLPGHPVGPILLAFGGLMGFYIVADAYINAMPGDPNAAVVAWAVSLLDGPLFVLVALVILVFPTGRPPSPGWRVVAWFDLCAAAGVLLGSAFRPGPIGYYAGLSNPFGIPDFPAIAIWEPAYLLLIGSVGLSALSLIGRWRRGGPVERAQLKWVASAASLLAISMAGYATIFGPGNFNDIADLAVGSAFAFFPIAISIAILRYRLFEIDRLVSRTIAYVVVTAVLVAAYASVILLLQGPLGAITGGDTIPVAISTLVVAALFQPLRRRVQSVVDRRFDRARFDAERTTTAFSERLRADVNIESVTTDLRATVHDALRPTRQGLWIRKAAE